MRNVVTTIAALLVLGGGTAFGQYVPVPIHLDGDVAPDGIGIIENTDSISVNGTGVVAFTADDDFAADDDILILGSLVFIREGAAVAGSGGTLDLLTDFETQRQLNAAGDVVFESTGLDGVATSADNVLHLNLAKLLQEGDPVDGVAGRLHFGFAYPSIADNGDVYLELDMDGATTDDEVLYLVPSGGTGAILAMNASTSFREGTLIIGGDLDGETWDSSAFIRSVVNGAGTLLVEGNLLPATDTDDEVLVRKRAGFDYELLAREGDSLTTLVGPTPSTIESITEHSIAGNDDWAAEIILADAISGTADEAVIASFGGAAPTIIVQEDQDLSALTGIAGTNVGLITGVSINSNGKVLVLVGVDDPVTTAPYDEALLLYEGGTLSIAFTDNIPVPALPGDAISDITASDFIINDQDRIFFSGLLTLDTGVDGVFEAEIPAVLPVESLACTVVSDHIDATWAIPAGSSYTGIRIYLDGLLTTTLGGAATAYSTPNFTENGFHTISVEAFSGGDDAPQQSCAATVAFIPADFVECSVPVPPAAIDSTLADVVDVLNVVTNVVIDDLALSLDITHSFQADLEMDVVSPAGTQVFLASDIGGTLDNVDITFADFGEPIVTASNMATGGYLQPEGPGTMADFRCEFSSGAWSLTINDDAGGDTGTLDQWCLEVFENTSPGLDCCPQRTDLVCSNVGACGGPGVNLSWTNNFSYTNLELRRVESGVPVTIPLAPSATSYSDTTVVAGSTYTYTLRYQCAVGGPVQDSVSCTIPVNVTDVPAVQGLTCTADPCGTGDVSLAWTNGATYTSLTLNRAGVFLADVTGLTSFTDIAPLAGLATYSLIADCGGSTIQTDCAVTNSPPAVTNLVCDADLCANLVSLTWDTNGVPYDQLTLNRAGVFLADVTGLNSFSDLSPPGGGPVTYTVFGTCGGVDTPLVNCVASLSLELPSDLVCSAPIGSDTVTITWTNPVAYTVLEIRRDGVLVTPQPPVGATSYTDSGLPQGAYSYTITFGCNGVTDDVLCAVGVVLGNEFLLIPRDGTTADGIGLHDPATGQFLVSFVDESTALELYQSTNAILGPRLPGGDEVVYLADSVGIDNGSVVRYELDGTFMGQYIDDTLYDDVRGIEFQGDTLYFTSQADDVVVAYDIGTLTASTFIAVDGPTDIEFLSDGSVLVGSWVTDSITRYDSMGLNPVVLVSSLNSTIADPNQIAPLSNGNFIVGTEGTGSDEIIEFTLAGTVVQSWPIGFNVEGVYELPGGTILFTTDAGTGVFTLDPGTGTVTNIYDNGTADYYYIERISFGPVVVPTEFVRGNSNGLDDQVNIADAVYLLGHLFPSPGNPPNVLNCFDAGDANDDGAINIADAVALLGSLFGSPAVPLPLPNTASGCGEDPTADSLDCATATPGC